MRWCHELVAGICLFTEASWQFVRGHVIKRRSVIMEAPPSPSSLPHLPPPPPFVWPLPISLSLLPLAAVFVQHRLLPIHSFGSNAESFTSAHYNASVFTFPAQQYAQQALQTQSAVAQTKVLNKGSSLIQVPGPDPHPEVSLQLVKPLTSKGHLCCMKMAFPKLDLKLVFIPLQQC